MISRSSSGWSHFLLVLRESTYRCKDGQSIDELQRLVIVTARMNAEPNHPHPFCVREQLAGAYLRDFAWSPQNGLISWPQEDSLFKDTVF